MLSDLREETVCKQFNEGLNKFYTELIVFMYTQKIKITFDRSLWIRPRKQIIPEQNNSVAHLYTTLVFYRVSWTVRNIILCHKGRFARVPLLLLQFSVRTNFVLQDIISLLC